MLLVLAWVVSVMDMYAASPFLLVAGVPAVMGLGKGGGENQQSQTHPSALLPKF